MLDQDDVDIQLGQEIRQQSTYSRVLNDMAKVTRSVEIHVVVIGVHSMFLCYNVSMSRPMPSRQGRNRISAIFICQASAF